VPGNESQKNVRRVAVQILRGVAVFSGVVALATLAYWSQGWSLGDSFYMVIITIFGVGYEEVEPCNTTLLRFITILTIIAGPVTTVYVISTLVKIITEKEFQKALADHKKNKNMDEIKNHTIICGFGRIGQTIARELQKADQPFIILDRDAARIELSESRNYMTLEGDAGDEEVLTNARIMHARTLTAVLPNDMVNVFITLTARNMNPNLRIIARAEDPTTEKKLRQAGANEVILPALAGGLQIAHRINRPSLLGILDDDTSFIRNDLDGLGVGFEETTIDSGNRLIGQPLATFLDGTKGRSIILAVRRTDGTTSQHPGSHLILREGDRIVFLMRRSG
jgi:voltage-gated potassium channel